MHFLAINFRDFVSYTLICSGHNIISFMSVPANVNSVHVGLTKLLNKRLCVFLSLVNGKITNYRDGYYLL